jgi:hypothetical protein
MLNRLAGIEAIHDHEPSLLAPGARRLFLVRTCSLNGRSIVRLRKRRRAEQLPAKFQFVLAATVGEKPVVADGDRLAKWAQVGAEFGPTWVIRNHRGERW